MFLERRKHERKPVKNCTVRCCSNGSRAQGVVLNISEGGMMINGDHMPEMFSEMEVFISRETGGALKKKGVVAWVIQNSPPEKGALFGLKFL